MFNRIVFVAVALTASALAQAESAPWPEWVMDPSSFEGRLAASDCVPYSGSLNIDRQQVAANARVALAQQISVKIKAMDKTYQSRVDDGKASKIRSSFESSSEQTVDAALNGVRLKKVEIIKNSEGRFLCGLLTLEQGSDTKLVRDLMVAKSVDVDKNTEEILLAKFRERSAKTATK